MAELLSPQRLSDIRAFEREWIALRECVSPRTDKQQQYLTAIDWRRLLLLAREHGVLGQLAACLADRDASAIPPEIKPVLAEHRRAQNFLTLRLTGELFRLLELFNQRSEEHTSELQSRLHLVCRLLLEKKNNHNECIVLVH